MDVCDDSASTFPIYFTANLPLKALIPIKRETKAIKYIAPYQAIKSRHIEEVPQPPT